MYRLLGEQLIDFFLRIFLQYSRQQRIMKVHVCHRTPIIFETVAAYIFYYCVVRIVYSASLLCKIYQGGINKSANRWVVLAPKVE